MAVLVYQSNQDEVVNLLTWYSSTSCDGSADKLCTRLTGSCACCSSSLTNYCGDTNTCTRSMVDGIVNVTCYYDGYSCGDSYERLTLMSEYVGPTHTCLPCPAFNLTGTSYIPNCSYRIDLGSRVAPRTIAIYVLVSVIVVVAVVIIGCEEEDKVHYCHVMGCGVCWGARGVVYCNTFSSLITFHFTIFWHSIHLQNFIY